PIIIRIALIYAVIDSADLGIVDAQIYPEHLRAALAVWQYCEDSARRIFGDITGDPVADTILAVLRATPGGLTRNAIRDLFSRHESSSEITEALRSLLGSGKVRTETTPTAGRPVERWYAMGAEE